MTNPNWIIRCRGVRSRPLKKFLKAQALYYNLQTTRVLKGVGGCRGLTPKQERKHNKLKAYVYGHPLYQRVNAWALKELDAQWTQATK